MAGPPSHLPTPSPWCTRRERRTRARCSVTALLSPFPHFSPMRGGRAVWATHGLAGGVSYWAGLGPHVACEARVNWPWGVACLVQSGPAMGWLGVPQGHFSVAPLHGVQSANKWDSGRILPPGGCGLPSCGVGRGRLWPPSPHPMLPWGGCAPPFSLPHGEGEQVRLHTPPKHVEASPPAAAAASREQAEIFLDGAEAFQKLQKQHPLLS